MECIADVGFRAIWRFFFRGRARSFFESGQEGTMLKGEAPVYGEARTNNG
jgi:hypothetical protein